jgi:hypothetical protein
MALKLAGLAALKIMKFTLMLKRLRMSFSRAAALNQNSMGLKMNQEMDKLAKLRLLAAIGEQSQRAGAILQSMSGELIESACGHHDKFLFNINQECERLAADMGLDYGEQDRE